MKLLGDLTNQDKTVFQTPTDNKAVTIAPPATLAGASNTFTTPAIAGTTDTLVSLTSTDTLTNKTITAPLVLTELQMRAAAPLKFYNAGNTQFVSLQAGVLAGNTSFTLPVADGTSGQVMSTNGSAQLGWSSVLTSPLTTTGDIIYSSSGSTAARLGIGNTSQVLGVAAGVPAWTNTLTGTSDTVELKVLGNATQTSNIFEVQKSDATSLLAVTNTAGTQIRGSTTNTTVAAGFVGEVISATSSSLFSQVTPTGGQFYDVTGLSVTLTAGVWHIFLSAHAQCAPTGAGSLYNVVALRTGSTVIASGFASEAESIAEAYSSISLSQVVSISASTTYKTSVSTNIFAGSPTAGTLYERGDATPSYIYAVRIA